MPLVVQGRKVAAQSLASVAAHRLGSGAELPSRFKEESGEPPLSTRPAFRARFNAGRFRVTTEEKHRPLARFGCSMVWRLISAFRAVHQPAEAGASTNRDLKDCRIRQSNQQRIVSVILPICVHLRNLRTRNLRLIHPDTQLAQDRAWRFAPTDYLSGLLPPGLFPAHLTVLGGGFVRLSRDQ
jgi:hypothetical protein